MKKRFDKFAVEPVKKVDGVDSQYDCFERCEKDDPDLHAWAVYGYVDGLAECLADCSTEEAVEYVKAALDIAYFKHPAVVQAAEKVICRWEAGDLAEAIRLLAAELKK